jgi:hypothetical protein
MVGRCSVRHLARSRRLRGVLGSGVQVKAMEEKFRHLDESDFRLYKAMQEWHDRIGDMLAYVNDVLTPHGIDEIVKDAFAGLRQTLKRRQ